MSHLMLTAPVVAPNAVMVLLVRSVDTLVAAVSRWKSLSSPRSLSLVPGFKL